MRAEKGDRFALLLSASLLVLCLVVILWGAFVRFSRSGDGCGESWPLCHGEILPEQVGIATWIEYTHRVTSGIFGIGIGVLLIYVLFFSRMKLQLRNFAIAAFLFTISEALIGAGLVLRGMVAENDTVERIFWLAGHLLNTLLLLYFLVGVVLQSKYDKRKLSFIPSRQFAIPLVAFILLAIAGSLASLSNTLHPSSDLGAGLAADLSLESPLIVRLRVLHPICGVLFFGLVIYWWKLLTLRFPGMTERLLWLVGVEVLVGATTLLMLSPLTAKLLHLFLADIIWLQLAGSAIVLSERDRLERFAGTLGTDPVGAGLSRG
ncbi:MAG: COX15/CtaA family protein [Bdellovibrionales bacterium]|nr:COX15/CtaA family protein [Bdellovibrionales bacterium]